MDEARPAGSYTIEHQCPQCGAPAVFQETERLFSCPFCRVTSFLSSPVFHYLLPNRAPKGARLLYLPYWRFKGMVFFCHSGGIGYRIVDVSHRAVKAPLFPPSLGLRDQVLRLRFVSPAAEGHFVRPSLDREAIFDAVGDRFATPAQGPTLHRAFIGERLCHVYAPFYVENALFDAVVARSISAPLSDHDDPFSMPGGQPDWRLRFLTAQCPSCGWDLEGDRDTLALACRNCSSVWEAGEDAFARMPFAHLPADETPEIWLPFWRIRAKTTGVELDTVADLVHLANLPRVIQRSEAEAPFYFWTPAFKVRPADFLFLSRALTLSQPGKNSRPLLPEGRLYPVTLPSAEAGQSLLVHIAGFAKPQRTILRTLPEIQARPLDRLLVYIPFRGQAGEWISPSLQLRISRNVLKYGRGL